MKKIIVVSGLFLMLLTAGVSNADAQISIILNSPGYGYNYPNNGYGFYPGQNRGCGGYNNYGYNSHQGYNNGWGNGNRGGYGYNYGWGNGGRDWDRGGRGGGHHNHGCR